MAGRIRQLMWESNRRQPGEGTLGCLFFFLLVGLPLIIISHGKILFFFADILIPFFFYFLFTL